MTPPRADLLDCAAGGRPHAAGGLLALLWLRISSGAAQVLPLVNICITDVKQRIRGLKVL
jgi:hypothetical protein